MEAMLLLRNSIQNSAPVSPETTRTLGSGALELRSEEAFVLCSLLKLSVSILRCPHSQHLSFPQWHVKSLSTKSLHLSCAGQAYLGSRHSSLDSSGTVFCVSSSRSINLSGGFPPPELEQDVWEGWGMYGMIATSNPKHPLFSLFGNISILPF